MTPDPQPDPTLDQLSSGFDPLDAPAEEFLARYRRGERPSLTEYEQRFPALAGRIRALFPALVEMEQLGHPTGDAGPTGLPEQGIPTWVGEFRVLRKVGEGGMGVVYEAVQESLGRHVALKVLPPNRTGTYLDRFKREARAAARLHHTNIVPVFAVGEADGLHYYAMQFIPGQGLDSVLEEVRRLRAGRESTAAPGRAAPSTLLAGSVAEAMVTGVYAPAATPAVEKPLPPSVPGSGCGQAARLEARYYREVARIGVQAAEALHYAHAQGILHRDVKPSNLLLDLHGTVWVTDFGLAKADDDRDLTQTGDIIGTLRYMAPERFTGKAGPRSEVYALGVTLFELLTLRPAFAVADRVALIRDICQTQPPRPRVLDSLIPRDLETVVLKAIAPDPAERYPTAAALADDLRRFVNGEPVAVRRAGLLERAYKWARRKPAVAGLYAAAVAGAVLVAVTALVVSLWREAAAASSRAETSLGHEKEARSRVQDLLVTESGLRTNLESALTGERTAKAGEVRLKEHLARLEYARTVDLAHREWRENNIARARELLASCREDLRGWEWHHVHRLCHADLVTLQGHTGSILAAAWNRDGSKILTASNDRTARVWDAGSGRELVRFTGHADVIWVAEWSTDGSKILTASNDGTARVWDAASGKELARFQGHRRGIRWAAWNPDGTKVVSVGFDDEVPRVWDAASGKEITPLRGHTDVVDSAAWSPDGTKVVTVGGDQVARVWDAASGKQLTRLRGHTARVYSAAWNLGGSKVVTASFDRTARVWDVASGNELATLAGHKEPVRSAAFSPDGSMVATAGDDGTARVWDPETGKELALLLGHIGPIASVSWSTDGPRVATAGADKTARVWDARTGTELINLRGHTTIVRAVAYRPDGKQVVTAGNDTTACVWDATAGKECVVLATPPGTLRGAAWTANGKRVLTTATDGTARTWDAVTGRAIGPAEGGPTNAFSAPRSPDGLRVVTTGVDLSTRVCDAATGRELAILRGQEGPIRSVAWAPDGRRIVTASGDQTAKIWDPETGIELLTLKRHTNTVLNVDWSTDGTRILTAGLDGLALIWDTAPVNRASPRPSVAQPPRVK